jgi:branched-chain amino acid transport system substrate-binding protein
VKKFRKLAAMTFAVVACTAGYAKAQPLKVGVLATLEGTYAVPGQDSVRGVEVALGAIRDTAGGRQIQTIIGSTDATPESAIRAVRKLVEQDGVAIVLGPLSGSEGIAIRDYAKTQPNVTFINGSSAAMETTYVNPAPNFFRFNTDGAQWSAGLGKYAYDKKGYNTVATVGEDYSFVYTQVFGFVTEFCQAGGKIVDRQWVPLGTTDFASIIAALPDDVDAIYLGLGGADAVNFLNQYQQAGGDAKLIGGSIMVDGTVLNSKGKAKNALIGTPSSGPQADTWTNPKWQAWVKEYQDFFPADKRFPSPSLFATTYANATNAMIQCLDKTHGDLSGGETKFRACLSGLTLDAPNGPIRLDNNRQAIGPNFVTEVTQLPNGTLANKLVEEVPDVNQTLGIDPAAFAKIGLPSRTVPACKKSYQ